MLDVQCLLRATGETCADGNESSICAAQDTAHQAYDKGVDTAQAAVGLGAAAAEKGVVCRPGVHLSEALIQKSYSYATGAELAQQGKEVAVNNAQVGHHSNPAAQWRAEGTPRGSPHAAGPLVVISTLCTVWNQSCIQRVGGASVFMPRHVGMVMALEQLGGMCFRCYGSTLSAWYVWQHSSLTCRVPWRPGAGWARYVVYRAVEGTSTTRALPFSLA